MRILIAISLLITCNLTIVSAQFQPVSIPGSQTRNINSAIVYQDYELQILLPGGYGNSSKNYPVVYLMDSQWDFPLLKSIYGQQYYDGFIPEIIVVGVTWAGKNANADSLRVRDYTPSNDGLRIQGGGADRFLSFMRTELFPFIEKNYRADTSNRVLMGCSLGGLFALYTMFTQPEMFSGYVAASPAIGWDREVLYKYEAAFEKRKLEKPLKVYLTIGDVERSRPGFEKFAARMVSSKYSSVKMHSKILENTGHSGTKSETYSRGLQYIFKRPEINPDQSVLIKYSGNYQTKNGQNKVWLKNENGRLALYVNERNSYSLLAASDTVFYSNSEFLGIRFKLNGNVVEGFYLDRYGNTGYFSKD